MSRTIDQRVVEMRFDNKHFESNVQTSMSTLEKLKQSLNFSGAHKSFDGLSKAAGNVNMAGLGNAVDAVSARFSALQVMGVTALANITNSAVNAGKRMISALTIDPVKTGFQEYETQINAVQTILANTQHAGTDIHDVNNALDELNTYADETIYNFTEMTRNIGTFTAAGVDLETSVSSIKGIANLAAISGSTSQQASTAMYQLSQALAAGRVSLMDWNSVVNAGMGGKVFQDALVRTSELLGTGAKAAIDTYGSFRESLTRGEWLTTEVLTETLQQFAGAYSEADLIAQGFTESQAKEIAKMAETAKSAATDVKTFTQLWDVMKEAAQSGWSQTWRLLIGDMEDAKKLLSPIAEFFTGEDGIITKMSNARNKLLEGALSNPFSNLLDDISNFKGAAEEVTKTLTDFSDIVDKVIGGEFGNGQARWDKLTEAGYDWAHVQNLVNEKLGDSTRHATNYKETQEEVAETQEKSNKALANTITQLVNLSDAQLKEMGYSDEFITSLRTLEEQSEKTGIPVKDLLDDISLLEGRTLLINSFKNAAKGLMEVFKTIGDAWQEIFPPKSMEVRVASLYDMIAGLHKFSTKLTMTAETADKVKRVFKGVFAIIDIVSTVTGGALRFALEIVAGVLDKFGMSALDAAAALADNVVAFHDWMDEAFAFSDVIDFVVTLVVELIEIIHSMSETVKQSDMFKNFMAGLKDMGEGIRNWIAGIKDAENIPKYIIEGLVKGLTNGVKMVWDAALAIGKAIYEAVCDFLGIESPSKVFIAIGGFIISGLVLGLLNNIPSVHEALEKVVTKCKDVFGDVDWGEVLAAGSSIGLTAGVLKMANTFSKLTAPLEGVGDVLSGTGEVLEKSAKPIAKVIKNTAKVVKSFAKVMSGIAFKKTTEGIRNLAISLGILVLAIAGLALLNKYEVDLWEAVKVVGVLAGVLAALAFVAGHLTKSSMSIGKEGIEVNNFSTVMFGIAGAILALAVVMKIIGSMDPNSYKQGLAGLGIIAVGILAFIAILTTIGMIPAKRIVGTGSNLMRIAGAIAVLAIVAKVMAGMSWGEIDRAKIGLGMLVGCVALLMLIGMIPGKHLGNLGSNILKIAGAIGILAIVAKLMAGMTWSELGKATVGLGMLMGCITLLMLIGMIPAKRIRTLGSNLLKVAGAMAVLAIVAKLIATMEWDEMGKAAVGIIALAGIIAGLIAATRLASGNDLTKVGSTILLISVAIGILAGVLTLLGFLNMAHIGKGLLVVGALAAMMAGLIFVTKYAKDCKSNLVIMAVAIGVMAAAVAALSFIDTKKLVAATGAIALLMGMFALMTAASGKAGGSMKSLILMTVVVGLLGWLLVKLSNMQNPSAAIATAKSISILLATMSGVLYLISTFGKADTRGATRAIGNMALLVFVVAEIGAILGLMSYFNAEGSIETAASISIVLAAMAGVLYLISTFGKADTRGATAAVANMILLGIVVAEIGAVLGLMSYFNAEGSLENAASISILLAVMGGVLTLLSTFGKADTIGATAAVGNMALLGLVVAEIGAILGIMSYFNVEASITNVTALSILLGVMAGVLVLVSSIGKADTVGATIAVANMALLGLVVGELAVILGIMSTLNIEASLTNVIALSTLLGVMSGVLVLISTFGKADTLGATVAVGNMALLGLVVGELAAILGVMAYLDIEPSIETASALSILLVTMSGVLILLSAVGAMGPAAFIGIGALATLIAGIGGLIVGIGALMDKFPMLEDFLNNGIPVVEKIGYAIGSFFGNIVGGFLGNLTSGLPDMATDLSNFMTNLQPFIEGSKNITQDVIAGVGYLSGAIVALTLADLIQGIGSFLTLGSSFADLGTELSGFMINAMPFIAGAALINPEMLTGVRALADTVLILTAANVLEGLTAWFTGGSTLASFGAQLPQLATDLNSFATNLGTFDESKVTSITCATNAIKALATAAESIPNEGGLWAKIVGDNSLATFGSYLPELGTNLNSFATNLGAFDETKVTTITCAANAIKALAAAADTIPNEGGWAAKILGDNSIATFGSHLPELGSNLGGFATNLGAFNEDTVTTVKCASNAIKAIAQAADAIPNDGGLWAKIVGDNSLATFGSQLPGLGTNLSGFVTNLGTFDEDKVATVKCAGDAIVALAKASENIDGQAEWAKKIFGDNGLAAFSSEFGTLGTNLSSFVSNLGTFTSEQVSTVKAAVSAIKAFSDLADADLKGATKHLDDFGADIVDLASDVSDFVADMPESSNITTAISNIKKILSMIQDISGADTTIATDFTNSLKEMGKAGVDAFVKAFTSDSAKSDVKKAGVTLIKQVVKGIESEHKALKTAGTEAGEKAADGADDAKQDFYDAGSSLVSGFASGISENSYKATAKAKAMAEAAAEAAKKALKINSPSKIFMAIGSSIPEGFAMGIEDLGSSIKDATISMSDTAIEGVSKSISRIADLVNTDIDSQPTIRPVLDLTDVRSGANSISSLFNNDPTVGIMRRVNTISSSMNNRNQNGTNGEVVSAIDKLRKDIGNIKGDNYNINGVSYSGESDVANAIRILTKAALMERRT